MSGTTIAAGADFVTTSTISGAIFQPEVVNPGFLGFGAVEVVGGETVSGVLTAEYNATGTLIGAVGTMVLTETLNTGGVTTETFVVNGVGTVANTGGEYGEGINANDDSNNQFEIFLQSVSSTGTGPLFTDLHIDWNGETNPQLYLGTENSFYNALIGPSLTTEDLLSVGAISTTDTIYVDYGNTVTLANQSSVNVTPVVFGTHGSAIDPNILDINYPVSGTNSPYQGTIAGFGADDEIILGPSVLPGTETSFSVLESGGLSTLTVTSSVNGVLQTDTLTFSSLPGDLTVTNGTSGIVISDIPCFASGTRILTATGQMAVEDIKPGTKVLTARDGAPAEVTWVGSRTVDLARHAMPEKVRPVRILAGAFGEGLPARDLRLSPDHALFIDGHLIEAKTLVNGVTVIEDSATRLVTYHHIELASHDIMLAEGLPAESYLDSGNRGMFESDAGPITLHPDFAAASRAKACAPLVETGDVVLKARAKLLERAASLGFIATAAIDLTANVAGETIAPEMRGREMSFLLPAGAARVELISSVGVPAETSAEPGDRRVLGVAVTGLALVAGGRRMVIPLEDPAHTGFHAMEAGHRWTNGSASIALPAYTGRAVLEVTINGQAARWIKAA